MKVPAAKGKKIFRPSALAAITVGVAVLIVCVRLAISFSGPARSAGALLVLPANVRDLGRMPASRELHVPFQIGNAGTRRLVLNELDLECCCGDHALRTILVAPDKTVEIQVPFHTRCETGLVERIVSFTTNDPAQPRLDLTVRAMVAADKPVLADRNDCKQPSVLIPP